MSDPQVLKLLGRYLCSCIDRGLSPKSVRAYRIDLTQYAACSAGAIPTRDDLAAFKEYIRPLAPASRKRKLASLSAFCHWLEDEDIVAAPIFKKRDFSVKVPEMMPRNLSREAVEDLLAGLKNHRNLVVRLLLFTGLRVLELCSLDVCHYDSEGGTFRVLGKGRRERTVPVADRQTLDHLSRYIRERGAKGSDPLLVNRNGERLRPDSVRKIIHRVAPDITPHMLRHTCATLFVEAGMNPRHLQRFLGHSSITTTEKYIHLSEVSLREAVHIHKLPIAGRRRGERGLKPQAHQLRVNEFVSFLYEKRGKLAAFLTRLGAKDPDEIIQEIAIEFAQSPPPGRGGIEACVKRRLKWALLSRIRDSKALKRGGGRVQSLDAIPEGLI